MSRRPWLLALPAALALLLAAGLPLARTIALAFTDARLGTLGHSHFIGLTNFAALLSDPDWWTAALNTVIFAVVTVVLEVVLGLAVALLLHQKMRGRGALRAAVLVPWAIPTVVCARIWAWMFHDLNGVVNEWLLALHWIQAPLPWLGNDRLARVVVMAVDLWKSTPFVAVLLLAGLQSIPAQVKESARVDGLSRSSEFLHITLPLLRPAIAVAALFRTLDALRVFDLPFVLTSNSRGAAYLSTFARTQIVDFQEVGYGSAASVLIFVAIGAVAVLYLRMAQSSLGLTKEPNG